VDLVIDQVTAITSHMHLVEAVADRGSASCGVSHETTIAAPLGSETARQQLFVNGDTQGSQLQKHFEIELFSEGVELERNSPQRFGRIDPKTRLVVSKSHAEDAILNEGAQPMGESIRKERSYLVRTPRQNEMTRIAKRLLNQLRKRFGRMRCVSAHHYDLIEALEKRVLESVLSRRAIARVVRGPMESKLQPTTAE
jgi:hypothetical protein